uniref:Uncharacterized protein n=2 Tax=gambiae species complex TaxID=44542 RepID=A0A8W7P4M0_ANOCL
LHLNNMKPFRATGRLVLGLELALLLLLVCGVTHAHTEPELPAAAASAQVSPGDATGLAADAGQHLPPAIDAKTDDSAGKSVVVNWKLACKQLCSAGLGGPSCGSTWLRTTTSDSPTLPVDKDTLDGVCPSLCANGLGVAKCNCTSFRPKDQFDQNLICQAFCTVASVQLAGCSRCDGTDPSLGNFGALEIVETTTPNWDELCSMFCKMGDGGTLCNCDLPPFF